MRSDNKKRRRLLIQLLVGLVIAVAVAFMQGLSLRAPAEECWRRLCDGCFLTSALYLSLGGLMWISTTGFFDILSYGGKIVLSWFTWKKDMPSYFDYKAEQDEKREGKAFTGSLLLVGFFLLALSFLCLLLFYHFIPAV